MNDINMIDVESSNVSKIGYDDTNSRLHVQFKNGAKYVYDSVPRHKFDEMTGAESVGQYLNTHIKGTYGFERVG